IRESLVKACQHDMRNWHRKVPLAFFADRITVSKSTGFSPHWLLYGVHPILPLDLCDISFMVEGFVKGISTSDLLVLRMKQLERHEDDIASAAAVLKAARYRSKAQFEKRFHKVLNYDFYNPGDLVIIRNSKDEMTLGKKTMKRYLGPFEVDRRTRNGAYVIKELDGTYIRTSVAAFRLYPY
ncbi:hypothetical protein FIBSPDRAFT_666722, partial [Athelia psychrophila]